LRGLALVDAAAGIRKCQRNRLCLFCKEKQESGVEIEFFPVVPDIRSRRARKIPHLWKFQVR